MISEKRARWFLAALISVSTLGFTYLAYRKFACFRWETEDAAQFGYAFFQTLHGRFFPFYGREESLLGGHADFVQFLWYPFFRLAPSMVSLFFFQSLMISVAAWPAYLLARFHGCDRLTALIAAAGLLVFPAVVGQHVNQIHEDQYALVFLLFAFYFFEKQEFAIFGVFLVLVTLTKETFCLNTMMFGVYALLRRRRWPWVAAPVLWSAVYLFVMLRWALPAWGMGSKLQVGEMLYFSQYGHTPGEVLRYFASHPLGTLKIMVAGDRLKYLGLLLAPLLGVLAFGSWAWVPAVPSLLINLVGSNELLRHFYWHYSLIPGAILWTSFLISLPAWSAILQRRFGNRNYARIFCSIALALGISLSGLWLVPGQYVSDSACQSRRQAIAAVPLTASVLSPENMLAHFVRHANLNSLTELWYNRRDLNQAFDYDYIVFDAGYYDWPVQSQLFAVISTHADYRQVFAQDNVFVFQRVGTPPRTLRWAGS